MLFENCNSGSGRKVILKIKQFTGSATLLIGIILLMATGQVACPLLSVNTFFNTLETKERSY